MYVSKIAFSLPRWSLNLAAAVSKKVEKFSLHAQRGVSARKCIALMELPVCVSNPGYVSIIYGSTVRIVHT